MSNTAKKRKKNPIEEAKRYIENAKKILQEKGEIDNDGYFSDEKYMRMAGHTAYLGVLVALDGIMYPETGKPPKGRKDVEKYHVFLGKRNKTILKYFNTVYEYLHLVCGYDGELNMVAFKEGVRLANEVINWCELSLKNEN